MKLFLNLQNNRINLLNLLDLKLWELMYTLNRDIIEKYNAITQTDSMLEYMFQFKALSIFPPFYSHMIIYKNNNIFTTKTVETPDHLKCVNCIKLETKSETINITGTDHDVCVELNLELNEESKILEPAIKNIFKKIFARIKTYIESL
jgi:hypothetical protein